MCLYFNPLFENSGNLLGTPLLFIYNYLTIRVYSMNCHHYLKIVAIYWVHHYCLFLTI